MRRPSTEIIAHCQTLFSWSLAVKDQDVFMKRSTKLPLYGTQEGAIRKHSAMSLPIENRNSTFLGNRRKVEATIVQLNIYRCACRIPPETLNKKLFK
jgi:hypothetical protein